MNTIQQCIPQLELHAMTWINFTNKENTNEYKCMILFGETFKTGKIKQCCLRMHA